LLEVGLVELDAALKHINELFWWIIIVIPKRRVITDGSLFCKKTTLLNLSEVEDVILAVGDHLVGDLGKKSGHSFISVVVSGDGMDHLNTVHQSWKGFLNGVWISIIKWLNELFKCLEVLDVILSLVQSFGNSQFNGSPSRGSKVDLVSWLAELVRWVLRSSCENIIDGSAVFASELLRDTSELSHLLLPVVKFLPWVGILVVLLLFLSSVECVSNLFTPLVEKFFKIGDHIIAWSLRTMNIFGLVFPFSIKVIKLDVLGETFERFFELIGKFVEVRGKLLLLVLFALAPIVIAKLVNKWFENLVDDGVQRVNGVFTDLTKKDLIVTGIGLVDLLALGIS
jgi:hypothetical protein